MEGINLSLITEVADVNKVQFRGNKVLVRPSEQDAPKTSGGVIVPETSKIKEGMLSQGTVVSVCKQVEDLKKGDTVFFYRQNSEGAIRTGTDVCFWFPEYALFANLIP